MSAVRSVVTGVGSYLPNRVVTNSDFAEWLDTSDDWIVSRSGIERRHFAADNELTSDLAIKAAQAVLADATPSMSMQSSLRRPRPTRPSLPRRPKFSTPSA